MSESSVENSRIGQAQRFSLCLLAGVIALGGASAAQAQLSTGLEAYYDFDMNLLDTSGAIGGSSSTLDGAWGGAGSATYLNATASGTAIGGIDAGTTGVTGDALWLGGDDGDDDHVSLGSPTQLDFGAGSFSISVWSMLPDDVSPLNSGNEDDGLYGPAIIANKSVQYVDDNDDGPVTETINGGIDAGWSLGYFSSAGDDWGLNVGDGVTPGPGGSGLTSDENDIGFGTWVHHVLVVDRSANEFRRYHNGSLEHTGDITGLGSLTSGLATTIGGRTGDDTLWGAIDDLAIWNRTVTESEVVQITASALSGFDIADIIAGNAVYPNVWDGSEGDGDYENPDNWSDGIVPNQNHWAVIENGDTVLIDQSHNATLDVDDNGSLKVDNGSTVIIDGGVPGTDPQIVVEFNMSKGDDGQVGIADAGHLVIENAHVVFYTDEDLEVGALNTTNRSTVVLGEEALLEVGRFTPDASKSQGYAVVDGSGDDLFLGVDGAADDLQAGVDFTMNENAEVRVRDDIVFANHQDGHAATINVTLNDDAIMRGGWDIQTFDDSGNGGAAGVVNVVLNDNALIRSDRSVRLGEDTNRSRPASDYAEGEHLNKTYITLNDNAVFHVGDRMTIGEEDGTFAQIDINGNATLRAGSGVPMDGGGIQDDSQIAIGGAEQYYDGFRTEEDGQGFGVVNVNGAGATLEAQRLIMVGSFGYGTLNQYAGTVRVTGDAPSQSENPESDYPAGERGGDMFIAYGRSPSDGDNDAHSTGNYNMSGGSLILDRDLAIGSRGTGELNVIGSDPSIDVGGDLFFGQQFGQDLANDAGGQGTLKATLTGSAHSVVNVNGTNVLTNGDLIITNGFIGAAFDDVLAYRPAAGDYSASPLEWLLIDFAGTRTGSFTLTSGLSDASLNGVEWAVRYDDVAGEVYLQALEVFELGDANLDGVVDGTDSDLVLANNGLLDLGWAGGDFNGDGVTDALDLAMIGLPGDLDGDGFVGLSDLDIILNNWNQAIPPGDPLADPTGDNFVGLADLDIVLNNWNAGIPPVSGANIPEPASLALFGLAGLAMIRRMR